MSGLHYPLKQKPQWKQWAMRVWCYPLLLNGRAAPSNSPPGRLPLRAMHVRTCARMLMAVLCVAA